MITIDDRHDTFGHVRLGGIGDVLAQRIASETPYESRAVILAIRNAAAHRAQSIASWG